MLLTACSAASPGGSSRGKLPLQHLQFLHPPLLHYILFITFLPLFLLPTTPSSPLGKSFLLQWLESQEKLEEYSVQVTLQDGWSRNWHCVKLAPGQRLSRGQGIIEPSGELRRIYAAHKFHTVLSGGHTSHWRADTVHET